MFMALLYLHWYVGNKHAYLGGFSFELQRDCSSLENCVIKKRLSNTGNKT